MGATRLIEQAPGLPSRGLIPGAPLVERLAREAQLPTRPSDPALLGQAEPRQARLDGCVTANRWHLTPPAYTISLNQKCHLCL